jgi:hypothetical protein
MVDGGWLMKEDGDRRQDEGRQSPTLNPFHASRCFTPKRNGSLRCQTLAGLGKNFLGLQTGHGTLVAWGSVDLNRHVTIV